MTKNMNQEFDLRFDPAVCTQFAAWRGGLPLITGKTIGLPLSLSSFLSLSSLSSQLFYLSSLSTFLTRPSLSLEKCPQDADPSAFVTWTASCTVSSLSTQRWQVWVTSSPSIQWSDSWLRPSLSCHLWIICLFPSLSVPWIEACDLPWQSVQLLVVTYPAYTTLLELVWAWTEATKSWHPISAARKPNPIIFLRFIWFLRINFSN